jgi:hypothetical protein
MGNLFSIGKMFTPMFTPSGEHPQLFRRLVGPSEDLHTLGANFTPAAQSSALGARLKTGLKSTQTLTYIYNHLAILRMTFS